MKQSWMKKFALIFTVILLISTLAACGQKDDAPKENENTAPAETEEPIELMVSAAASLTDALNQIKADFEASHDHVTITLNMASSGKLAQQIEQGAPVDIFISANQSFMNELEEKALIDSATRADVVGNDLVLITQADRTELPATLADLADEQYGQLAIGEIETVPAGKYAKQSLEAAGIWEQLQERIIYTSNVRQVLTYVESKNVDYGVVFASDAAISDQVQVVSTVDEGHDPILYPAAVVANSTHAEMAQEFIQYLLGDGAATLQSYGFRQP